MMGKAGRRKGVPNLADSGSYNGIRIILSLVAKSILHIPIDKNYVWYQGYLIISDCKYTTVSM